MPGTSVRARADQPWHEVLTGPEEVRARVRQPWHEYEVGSGVADELIQIHTHDARDEVLDDGAGKGKGDKGDTGKGGRGWGGKKMGPPEMRAEGQLLSGSEQRWMPSSCSRPLLSTAWNTPPPSNRTLRSLHPAFAVNTAEKCCRCAMGPSPNRCWVPVAHYGREPVGREPLYHWRGTIGELSYGREPLYPTPTLTSNYRWASSPFTLGLSGASLLVLLPLLPSHFSLLLPPLAPSSSGLLPPPSHFSSACLFRIGC